MKKETLVAGALLLGVLGAKANEPGELGKGVLVSKDDRGAVVRDCSTERLITVQYGTPESHTFLVGETIGFKYAEGQQQAIMVEHYPAADGCTFYHS